MSINMSSWHIYSLGSQVVCHSDSPSRPVEHCLLLFWKPSCCLWLNDNMPVWPPDIIQHWQLICGSQIAMLTWFFSLIELLICLTWKQRERTKSKKIPFLQSQLVVSGPDGYADPTHNSGRAEHSLSRCEIHSYRGVYILDLQLHDLLGRAGNHLRSISFWNALPPRIQQGYGYKAWREWKLAHTGVPTSETVLVAITR